MFDSPKLQQVDNPRAAKLRGSYPTIGTNVNVGAISAYRASFSNYSYYTSDRSASQQTTKIGVDGLNA